MVLFHMGVRMGKVSVKRLAINPWQTTHLSYGLSAWGRSLMGSSRSVHSCIASKALLVHNKVQILNKNVIVLLTFFQPFKLKLILSS